MCLQKEISPTVYYFMGFICLLICSVFAISCACCCREENEESMFVLIITTLLTIACMHLGMLVTHVSDIHHSPYHNIIAYYQLDINIYILSLLR